MKKRTALLVASIVIISLLIGCSKTKTVQDDQSVVEKTVLRVQWIGNFKQKDSTDPITGTQNKGMYILEEEFERLYPDIDVQFILMGWDDYQKKTQSMMMGDECDVYQAPGISALANQNLLEPLEGYIDKDSFDLGVYIDGQVDGWKVMSPTDDELQIYGLPLIGDTRYIGYDKQLFDDFGVPYLSKTPTIDEILDAAKKMTGINPITGEKTYGIFHKGADTADTVLNIAESYGGTWGTGFRNDELIVNFNSPEMVKALDMLKEINKYEPEGTIANQGGELWGTEGNNIAINLRQNPALISSINALGLGDRYGVSRLFINEEVGMGGLFVGSPVVISKNSMVKDAAWEYIKFTASDFFMNYFWENQRNEGLPVVNSIFEHEVVTSDANIERVLESMKYLWTPRYSYRAGQGRSALSSAVENALVNGVDSKKALDTAQKEVEKWVEIQ